eukprot:14193956-Alexandrium_andersonii.AAC.1
METLPHTRMHRFLEIIDLVLHSTRVMLLHITEQGETNLTHEIEVQLQPRHPNTPRAPARESAQVVPDFGSGP